MIRNVTKYLVLAGFTATGAVMLSATASADIVHNDDVIVDGSLCVGLDCVNGEAFGFSTIVLKENNLRIRFRDTSNTASFPTTDFVIEINSSQNGGLDYFAIRDCGNNNSSQAENCGNVNPFLIEGGANDNSLWISDSDKSGGSNGSRIGFGTTTPVVDLHDVSGNTPTLRLEQNGTSGFAPQTWDLAGNETSFFIRDATNGSALPFRIFPGAPSNSLIVEASTGDVGIGTTAPADALHVVEPATSPNNGAGFRFEESDSTDPGRLVMFNDMIFLQFVDGAGTEFQMDTSGNVTIQGTLTENSDRNRKTAIITVDEREILDKVGRLDIAEWSYRENVEVRHIGPMAQDFRALFNTGASELGLSSIDTSGVALASIKALRKENEELKARLAKIEELLAK